MVIYIYIVGLQCVKLSQCNYITLRTNMVTKCGMIMNCSKNFMGNCKTWNTKGIIDVKVQIWLTNVKYLSVILTLHGHIHVFTISKDIGINREKKDTYQTRNP